MAVKKTNKKSLNTGLYNFLTVIIALILTYVVAIRAIDTGSLWQYGLGLFLVGLAINQLIKAISNIKVSL